MKISRPVIVNTALAVVVVGALAGGYLAIANPFAASGTSSASQLTSEVQQGAVTSSITASGAIAAASQVDASFAVSGTIATVDTTLGATVTAGQVIGTLDAADLKKALTKANTSYSNAASSLSDAKQALSQAQADQAAGTGSSQQVSSAKQQVTSAQSSVNDAADAVTTAKENVASATLTAPIAGLVVALNGTVGASAGSGASGSDTAASSAFATIADTTKMTMTANIAEADIASVAVGQKATVTFPALTDVTADATVTAVAPTSTSSNSVVTYATTITLDAIPAGLRLGQTAEVSIVTASSAEDALYVPTAAITTASDGSSTVEVVADDGTSSTVTVELGVVGDNGTEITSGLEVGQTVVIGTVAADTGTSSEDAVDQRQQMGGFTGGGTPPIGGTFPGGAQ